MSSGVVSALEPDRVVRGVNTRIALIIVLVDYKIIHTILECFHYYSLLFGVKVTH